MDRENIKTIILIVLVIISVFFTSKMWIEVEYSSNDIPDDDDFLFDDNSGILEVIAPDRIAVHLNGNKILVMNPSQQEYQEIWAIVLNNSVKCIAEGDKTDFVLIDKNIWEEQKKEECLELIFKTPFDLKFWNKAFNSKKKTLPNIRLSRLIISLDMPNTVLLFDDETESYYKISKDNINPLTESMLNEITNSDELKEHIELSTNTLGLVLETGIYVPKDPLTISGVTVIKEDIKPDELVKDFFSDMSVVRKIEEKDGARIYTDGKKGFRIYPSGAIEFNHAVTAQGDHSDDLFDAAKTGYNFLVTYGGLPTGSYLDKAEFLEHDPRSSLFAYDYRFKGIPVIGERNAIEIVITQGEVKNYYRNLEHPVALISEEQALSISPVSTLEIAASNLRFLINTQEDKHKIKDVYLAYYRPDDDSWEYTLSPVWVVELKDIKIFIDAVEGTMISLD
ncbi:MAG TPA: hypothetical protein GXZ31_02815 [Thermoanaerobacterales bacterium]|nr:hypothetical protein [Thermoanaerobacterales bacterium]